ncbi:hypothetical protein GGD38_001753 [Chitinophagaceae bacterium OAS944]|nr:hypothetical protein [Chitinophagaceae bacterium OAS944]
MFSVLRFRLASFRFQVLLPIVDCRLPFSNAAGVSFYEHLGDNELVFSQFTTWIKKDVYFDHRDLLSARFGADKMKQLDKYYGWAAPKRK